MKLNELRLDIHDHPKHGKAFLHWNYGDSLDDLIKARDWLTEYIAATQDPVVRATSATHPILHD